MFTTPNLGQSPSPPHPTGSARKIFDQCREHAVALFGIILGYLFACHGAASLFGVLGAKGPVAMFA